MPDFLATMAAGSRARVRDARSRLSESQLLRRASLRPVPPPLRLHPSFDVIAEIKPASPSAGRLTSSETGAGDALIERARCYGAAGASAISVLTEPSAFGGSLLLLEGLAIATTLPVLRKDFLVDPYQVAEARDRGASGVLLLARLLDDAQLGEMLEAAAALRLFCLIEAFDDGDLERALLAASLAEGTVLVGINTRDLATLMVGARPVPPARVTVPIVAESGFRTAGDVAEAAALGYRAALVGEALMRESDPTERLASMIRAGREAVTVREARG